MSEFTIIQQYFTDLTESRSDVLLGIGDDCALLLPSQDKQLATSIDTLVSGRHFLPDVHPETLGHKALAVNLSDLAAMGASPAWAMLALTLPEVDDYWLSGFSKGFAALAKRHNLQLIGGDTTSGPLSITVQVSGFVARDKRLLRSGAKVGDRIFVSATLGDAGLGLKIRTGEYQADNTDAAIRRLEQPEPRLNLGLALGGIASAAIDISDGLIADLGHICTQSRVGAMLNIDDLPISSAVSRYIGDTGDGLLPATAGDDYELCFTVAPENVSQMVLLALDIGLPLTDVGEIVAGQAVVNVVNTAGVPVPGITSGGYEHFS